MVSSKVSAQIIKRLALVIAITTASLGAVAQAAPSHDYFGRSTNSRAPLSSGVSVSRTAPKATAVYATPQQWYSAYDKTIIALRPTPAERILIDRPINQDPQRLAEWIRTVSKIEKNYRKVASSIRAMSIPSSLPALKDLRNLTADWYSDAAQVYADMITPRKPARTQEELDRQIAEIKERSDSLAQGNKTLKTMDMNIRNQLGIDMPDDENALQPFVSR